MIIIVIVVVLSIFCAVTSIYHVNVNGFIPCLHIARESVNQGLLIRTLHCLLLISDVFFRNSEFFPSIRRSHQYLNKIYIVDCRILQSEERQSHLEWC